MQGVAHGDINRTFSSSSSKEFDADHSSLIPDVELTVLPAAGALR
jgi:hypothetical protein